MQALGAEHKGPSEGILCQFRRYKEPDLLHQGEMGPFWRKGHIPTIQTQIRKGLLWV